MTGHDAQRSSRFPPRNTKPCCRQLARQNWPAFTHVGAAGATAPPGGGLAARLPPAAREWRRDRQPGGWDPPAWQRVRRRRRDDHEYRGHVSRAVLSRYFHVRMEAKRRALDEIAARQNSADEKRKKEAEQKQVVVVSHVAVIQ